MVYAVELWPTAIRDLKGLPEDVQKRIGKKIHSLADNPRPPGVDKLSGREDSYRVRVGDYRILYEIHDQVLLVIVVNVKHRREAYR